MVRLIFFIDEQIEVVVLWICYFEFVSNYRICLNKMFYSENLNNKRRGIYFKLQRNFLFYEVNDIKQ